MLEFLAWDHILDFWNKKIYNSGCAYLVWGILSDIYCGIPFFRVRAWMIFVDQGFRAIVKCRTFWITSFDAYFQCYEKSFPLSKKTTMCQKYKSRQIKIGRLSQGNGYLIFPLLEYYEPQISQKYPFTVETSIRGIIMFTIAFKLSVKTKIASLSLQIILQPAKKLSYPNRSLISRGLNQDYAAIIYKFIIQLSILNWWHQCWGRMLVTNYLVGLRCWWPTLYID